jgi:hypothetical protein
MCSERVLAQPIDARFHVRSTELSERGSDDLKTLRIQDIEQLALDDSSFDPHPIVLADRYRRAFRNIYQQTFIHIFSHGLSLEFQGATFRQGRMARLLIREQLSEFEKQAGERPAAHGLDASTAIYNILDQLNVLCHTHSPCQATSPNRN